MLEFKVYLVHLSNPAPSLIIKILSLSIITTISDAPHPEVFSNEVFDIGN